MYISKKKIKNIERSIRFFAESKCDATFENLYAAYRLSKEDFCGICEVDVEVRKGTFITLVSNTEAGVYYVNSILSKELFDSCLAEGTPDYFLTDVVVESANAQFVEKFIDKKATSVIFDNDLERGVVKLVEKFGKQKAVEIILNSLDKK